jgi:hypothetical protein
MKFVIVSLCCLSALFVTPKAASYADQVIAYKPGTGFATDFTSGAGLTNASSSLGEPARSTPGIFGGPVDPFNPAYLGSQLVSVGTGGSLTVHLESPAKNSAANPFGVDFIVYGNAGFIITNGDFSGGGITDGSLFGASSGNVRVSVSADNVNYYELSPSLAPVLDGLLPTDGAGTFGQASDPALKSAAFSGKDLKGIRAIYAGGAGGTGFDLDWARNAQGGPVNIESANYIRIDVLSGTSEISGFAVAVPEPRMLSLAALCLLGATGFSRRKG